ncbi:uncharacterized protein LOC131208531 [Anopheles bellator]|uniref:uncharacterized protein LOC131208531 n=1 Tax=Anopheles bellator TaxID=139047 RepID=UPI002648BAFA|nr:uncharacterized protein LOC131208531 [Anopheles bellator]
MCIIEHPLDGAHTHSTLKMGEDTSTTVASTSPNGTTMTTSFSPATLCGNKRKFEEMSSSTSTTVSSVGSDSSDLLDVVYDHQPRQLAQQETPAQDEAATAEEANDGIKACKSPRYESEDAQDDASQDTQGSKLPTGQVQAGHGSSTTSSSGGNKSNRIINATITTTTSSPTPSSSNSFVSSAGTISPFEVVAAPTILNPTAPILLTTPMSEENTIAKLEAVAVPGETAWNCEEPIVDSISKLQAVAVPGETWGGGGTDSTRSTLATTLLVADDLDDDDDDFEDDFDDDETILPGYSSMRYQCTPNRGPTTGAGGPGYITPAYPKPGYFPESYQNCARSAATNNGAQQYANRGYGWSHHGYYSPPYEAPSSQQTIRCAENGKSYFELGSASYSSASPSAGSLNPLGAGAPPLPLPQQQQQQQPQPHPVPFGGGSIVMGPAPRHHMKRCCDGRNMSCTNKQCYKERRLKMMNLSMFKLARFRQASDQSLYRSVLICNTLKSIEREIDNENKELNHQQHHQQHMQHQHHQQNHYHMQQHQHQQQQQAQQQMHHQLPPLAPPSAAAAAVTAPTTNQSASSTSGTSDYFANHRIAAPPSQARTANGGTAPQGPVVYSSEPSTITMQLSPYDQQQQQQQQHQMHPHHPLHHHHNPHPQSQQHHHLHHHHPLHPVAPPHHSAPHLLKDPQSGRATPFPVGCAMPAAVLNSHSDADSGFGDDDCTRPINWGSVLSLSSQSALDPLNGSDLFVTSPTGAGEDDVTPIAGPVAVLENCDNSASSTSNVTSPIPMEVDAACPVTSAHGESTCSVAEGTQSGTDTLCSLRDVDEDMEVIGATTDGNVTNGNSTTSSSSEGETVVVAVTGDSDNGTTEAGDAIIADPSVPAAPSATTVVNGKDSPDQTISSSSNTHDSSNSSNHSVTSTLITLTSSSSATSPLLSSCASALQHYGSLQHHHNQLHHFRQNGTIQLGPSSAVNGSLSAVGGGQSAGTAGSTGSSCWEFAYLDMDLGTTHELYDMFPSCYKIASFNSNDVDMLGLKGPMLEPSKVVCGDNEMDSFTTHIMVGS